jgi:hypothetical protein
MNRRLSRLAGLTAAGALALAAVAPVSAADEAMVRVLHASPDAPAVDIFLDGEKVDALTNVPFPTLSDYLAIPAGEHTVRVCATADNSVCPIPDTTLDFAAGTKYTVAATNLLASIEAQVIVDDPSPSTDTAQVRVVHFSADAPGVDVAPDGADPVVSNLEYPDATGYLDLPGGEYDLEVRLAGTSDVALDLDPITIENGRAYSVFAVGSAGGAEGAEPLQVVIGMDGMAAPHTDTVAGSTLPSTAIPAALLGILGILAFAGGLRLATVRARR